MLPWSVSLLLEEADAGPMSGAMNLAWTEEVFRLSIGGLSASEAHDPTNFTVQLHAESADRAEQRARELAQRVRRAAGLLDRPMPVAWVAPMSNSDESSHRFLEEAIELFDSEHFELAVVAAHIHLELQVRTLLRRAAAEIGERWAEKLAQMHRVGTLTGGPSEAAVQLLLGVDPVEIAVWPEFKAHVRRRNAVVHDGQTLGQKEAAASIAAVRQLWISLTEAARWLSHGSQLQLSEARSSLLSP